MDSARTLQESARSPAESEADFKVRESPRRTFLKSAADLSPAESARVRSDSGGLWRSPLGLWRTQNPNDIMPGWEVYNYTDYITISIT